MLDDGTIANKEVNLEAAIKNMGMGDRYWPTLPVGHKHASGALINDLSGGTGVGAANNMTLLPFAVPRACAVTEMGFYVDAAVAGDVAAAGIYGDAGGVPGALLASTGQLSTGATGWQSAAVSFTLYPGTPYWAAVAMTGADQNMFAGIPQSGYASQALGFPLQGGVLVGTVALVQALAAGWTALPATAAPTGTTTSAPVVFFNG